MSDQRAVCGSCRRETGDAARLCPTCQTRLDGDLREVPWLLEQLDITRSGMGTGGGPRVGGTRDVGLALHPKARAAHDALVNAITTWARAYGALDEARPPVTAREAAGWLRDWMRVIRLSETAGQLADEIGRRCQDARRSIDRPAEVIYAGICSIVGEQGMCEQDIYARVGAAFVRCPRCRTDHRVTDRRETLLASARDHEATATVLARILGPIVGIEIAAHRIVVWGGRGVIQGRGVDTKGTTLYRLGDVLDQLLKPDRVKTGRAS